MRRKRIDFDVFKTEFIDNPDGYFSVWSGLAEDDRVVEMDMICEYRLADGKVIFVEVPFNSQEELEEIKAYLRTTTKMLCDSILRGVENLVLAAEAGV